jgi:hypothetical protein
MDFIKQLILSRGSQLASRYIAMGLFFLAGKVGSDIPLDQITGSSEVLGTILAGGLMLIVDQIIHAIRKKSDTTPPAQPYNGPLLLALCALPLFMLSGCVQSSARAKFANEAQAAAATNYQKNVERLVYALIDDICDSAYAKADELAADAEKAETGPDGKANAQNLRLIQDKKLAHYKQIELNRIALRGKLIEASQDMEHLRQYSKALSDYWDKSASTAGLLNQSSDAMIGLLDKFVKGSKAQVIRNP